MGRNHELRAEANELIESCQERELPRRREGRLRLIENIEPVATKATLQQSKEGLPMGLLVERTTAIRR